MKSIPLFLLILAFYVFLLSLPLEGLFEYSGLTQFEVEQIVEIAKNLMVIVLAIAVMKNLRLFQLVGINGKSSWNDWQPLLLPSYLIFVGLINVRNLDFAEVSITHLVLLFFSTLSIGFSEEFVFRGLLQSLLLKKLLKNEGKKALFVSVMVSSIIFGLLHLLDFKSENAVAEASQFVYATFIGVGFGAILLRTSNIYGLAVIHGLIDFVFKIDHLTVSTGSKSEGNSSLISSLIVVFLVSPMFVFGLKIIKKLEVSSILKTVENES